jgi:adenine phosphoribosyltransferase
MDDDKLKWIRDSIREVPDFPKPGILFYDITTMIRDPRALVDAIDLLTAPFVDRGITAVVGMESRGFIFGVPVAERLSVGFVPVRKPGKLPAETVREEYELEYGTDSLEMHKDAVGPGDRVLVIDDLLATGGTAEATVRMIRGTGAEVAGAAFVIELGFLNGRDKLTDVKLHSLVVYD